VSFSARAEGTAAEAQPPHADAVPSKAGLRDEIDAAMPGERADLLADLVRRELMRVLRLDARHPPDLEARLLDLGLDSLMAVQLRNRIGAALALDRPLSATLVFDHPTCKAIAAYLDREFFGAQAVVAKDAAPVAPQAPVLDARTEDVERLSDEETEALLLKRLESIEGRRA
jgi:hypothetical protein